MNQGQFAAYIGLCRFERFQDSEGVDLMVEPGQTLPTFEAPMACWVNSAVQYDELLARALPKQGYRLLRTENVMPANTWFEMKGFNATLGELAAKVNVSRPFQAGKLIPVEFEQSHGIEGTTSSESEQKPLVVTEHPYTPLEDQTPIWPPDQRQWIDNDLKELLFGQELPEEHQHILGDADTAPLIRTYFIADATLRRKITKFFDLDMRFAKRPAGAPDIEGDNGNQGNIEYRSLFIGETQEELKEVAPYLFDLTLPEGAFDDPKRVPDFHKKFIESTWNPVILERSEGVTHLGTGIFIRTTLDFDTVWKHLRKFTLLSRKDGSRAFLNFYNPKILRTTIFAVNNQQNTLVLGLPALFIGLGRDQSSFILGSGRVQEGSTATAKAVGSLETYINATSIASYRAERFEDYIEKALDFLTDTFPWSEEFLGIENLKEGIRISHELDIQANITRVQDHFKLLTARFLLGSYAETDPFLIPMIRQIGWSSKSYRQDKLKIKQLYSLIDKLVNATRTDLKSIIEKSQPLSAATSKHEAWKGYVTNFPKSALSLQIDPSGKLICPDTKSIWHPDITPDPQHLIQLQYPLMGHRAYEDPFRNIVADKPETYQLDLQYFLLNLVS